MKAYLDDDEPQGLHVNGCNIWQTNDKPCNCKDLRSPHIPRLTTAQRIDLLLTCDEHHLQEGA